VSSAEPGSKPILGEIAVFWKTYLAAHPEVSPSAPVEAAFAGRREGTDALISLYLHGRKTAGSSLLRDFVSNGDPLPQPGDHWIALDSRDRPKIILKTVSTEVHRFKDVPERIAVAEGEGDLSLEYWKRVHAGFYAPHLAEWGIADIHDAEVVTEHFEIVHREPHPVLHQTERLAIRMLSPERHAAFMLELLTDADWIANIGDRGVRTIDDAAEYVRTRAAASYAKHGHGLYAVELRDTGEAVGICGLIQRDGSQQWGGAPDIGFALLPRHRGKGYVVESGKAIIDHARGAGLRRVAGITSRGNSASIRALEKLGLKFERTVKVGEWPKAQLYVLDLA